MGKTGVTPGWVCSGLSSVHHPHPPSSLRQRDLNLFVSSGDERGEWRQLAKLKETWENRESERNKTKKNGKTVKQIRETGGRLRREQRESAPGSNTRSLGKLYGSAAAQHTPSRPAWPQPEPLLPCTWRLRRDPTALLSSHSHYGPGSS